MPSVLCPICRAPATGGSLACLSCGASLEASGGPSVHVLPSGTRLNHGQYIVERVLGQGGFGVTYLGSEILIRRPVAIKECFLDGSTRAGCRVVPPGKWSAEEYRSIRSRFLEEAANLSRFSHPGLVRVLGAFEENDTAYMAMEYLEGETLGSRLATGTRLRSDEALKMLKEVAPALQLLHETRILHRDIKPDNIVMTRDGRCVLIDLGAAREFAAQTTSRMTQLVTEGYAPLEQYARSARFGPPTDIYALAATTYHALTGRVPPSAPDRAMGVELPSVDALAPDTSGALSKAIERALAMDAARRPSSVAEFLLALDGRSTSKMPTAIKVASDAEETRTRSAATGPTTSPGRRTAPPPSVNAAPQNIRAHITALAEKLCPDEQGDFVTTNTTEADLLAIAISRGMEKALERFESHKRLVACSHEEAWDHSFRKMWNWNHSSVWACGWSVLHPLERASDVFSSYRDTSRGDRQLHLFAAGLGLVSMVAIFLGLSKLLSVGDGWTPPLAVVGWTVGWLCICSLVGEIAWSTEPSKSLESVKTATKEFLSREIASIRNPTHWVWQTTTASGGSRFPEYCNLCAKKATEVFLLGEMCYDATVVSEWRKTCKFFGWAVGFAVVIASVLLVVGYWDGSSALSIVGPGFVHTGPALGLATITAVCSIAFLIRHGPAAVPFLYKRSDAGPGPTDEKRVARWLQVCVAIMLLLTYCLNFHHINAYLWTIRWM